MENLHEDMLINIVKMVPKSQLLSVAKSFIINRNLKIKVLNHIKLMWEQYNNFISFNNLFTLFYKVVDGFDSYDEIIKVMDNDGTLPFVGSETKLVSHKIENIKEMAAKIVPYDKIIIIRYDDDGTLLDNNFYPFVNKHGYFIDITIENSWTTVNDILYYTKCLAKSREKYIKTLEIIDDSDNTLTLEAFVVKVS